MADTIVTDAENTADIIKDNAAEFANEALKKTAEAAGKLAAQTEDVIQKHPYKSVLVAMGVGAILGVLFTRR